MSIWGMLFPKRSQNDHSIHASESSAKRAAKPQAPRKPAKAKRSAAIVVQPQPPEATIDIDRLLADRNVEELVLALSATDWNVRAKAAAALGKLKAASAAPLLCKALDGGFWTEAEEQSKRVGTEVFSAAREACIATAFALGAIGGEQAVKTLIKCSSVLNTHEFGRAISLVGESAVPSLLEELRKPDQDVCVLYCVLDGLGRIRDNRAFPAIVESLSHPNYNVGNAAIQALGRLGDKQAVGVLRSLSDKKPADDQSHAFVLGALGQLLAEDEVRRELVPAVTKGERVSWNHIDTAIAAWGDRADGALISDLMLLLSTSESIESLAIRQQVWLGVKRALYNALANALADHAAHIPKAQLEAMRSIPDMTCCYYDEDANKKSAKCDFKDVRDMARELMARADT